MWGHPKRRHVSAKFYGIIMQEAVNIFAIKPFYKIFLTVFLWVACRMVLYIYIYKVLLLAATLGKKQLLCSIRRLDNSVCADNGSSQSFFIKLRKLEEEWKAINGISPPY